MVTKQEIEQKNERRRESIEGMQAEIKDEAAAQENNNMNNKEPANAGSFHLKFYCKHLFLSKR